MATAPRARTLGREAVHTAVDCYARDHNYYPVLQYLEARQWDGKPRVETWLMRVRKGKITEHWGVANLFSLMQKLAAWPAKQDRAD